MVLTLSQPSFFKIFAHPVFNPLPVQFKSLLPGQEGCVFFIRHLNVHI
jgi:hypothetical protein